MQTINQLKEKISECIANQLPENFAIAKGPNLLTDENDDAASFEVEIKHSFGNINKSHHIQIGFEDRADLIETPTIEIGEDLERYDLTWHQMIQFFYYDLAYADLDSKFIMY
jgi:hypothetical protein